MASSIFSINQTRLLGAGRVHPDATWRVDLHAHPFWEFIYFIRGCGKVDLPHATLKPQYYHLLIFPPGMPHAETADPIDPEETIFISVDVPGTALENAPLLLADPSGDLRWLIEHIAAEVTTDGRHTLLATTLTQLFLQLVERSWLTAVQQSQDQIDLVMQYLHTNYASQITLESLGMLTHLSPTHLTHRFTKRVGISPMQYLKSLRIEAAKHLLVTTDLSVNEIALRVGYADPLYFRRVFKRITEMTPSGLRAVHANA